MSTATDHGWLHSKTSLCSIDFNIPESPQDNGIREISFIDVSDWNKQDTKQPEGAISPHHGYSDIMAALPEGGLEEDEVVLTNLPGTRLKNSEKGAAFLFASAKDRIFDKNSIFCDLEKYKLGFQHALKLMGYKYKLELEGGLINKAVGVPPKEVNAYSNYTNWLANEIFNYILNGMKHHFEAEDFATKNDNCLSTEQKEAIYRGFAASMHEVALYATGLSSVVLYTASQEAAARGQGQTCHLGGTQYKTAPSVNTNSTVDPKLLTFASNMAQKMVTDGTRETCVRMLNLGYQNPSPTENQKQAIETTDRANDQSTSCHLKIQQPQPVCDTVTTEVKAEPVETPSTMPVEQQSIEPDNRPIDQPTNDNLVCQQPQPVSDTVATEVKVEPVETPSTIPPEQPSIEPDNRPIDQPTNDNLVCQQPQPVSDTIATEVKVEPVETPFTMPAEQPSIEPDDKANDQPTNGNLVCQQPQPVSDTVATEVEAEPVETPSTGPPEQQSIEPNDIPNDQPTNDNLESPQPQPVSDTITTEVKAEPMESLYTEPPDQQSIEDNNIPIHQTTCESLEDPSCQSVSGSIPMEVKAEFVEPPSATPPEQQAIDNDKPRDHPTCGNLENQQPQPVSESLPMEVKVMPVELPSAMPQEHQEIQTNGEPKGQPTFDFLECHQPEPRNQRIEPAELPSATSKKHCEGSCSTDSMVLMVKYLFLEFRPNSECTCWHPRDNKGFSMTDFDFATLLKWGIMRYASQVASRLIDSVINHLYATLQDRNLDPGFECNADNPVKAAKDREELIKLYVKLYAERLSLRILKELMGPLYEKQKYNEFTFQPTPCSTRPSTAVDTMEETPCQTRPSTPVNKMEETPCQKRPSTPVNKMEETPCQKRPATAVETMEETPYQQRPPTPVETMEETPYQQRPPTPVDKMEEAPYQQRPPTPVETMEETPYQQRPPTPVDKMEEAPYQQRPPTPVDKMEEAPCQQRPYTPVEKMEDTPCQERPSTPSEQMERTPCPTRPSTAVEKMEETPPCPIYLCSEPPALAVEEECYRPLVFANNVENIASSPVEEFRQLESLCQTVVMPSPSKEIQKHACTDESLHDFNQRLINNMLLQEDSCKLEKRLSVAEVKGMQKEALFSLNQLHSELDPAIKYYCSTVSEFIKENPGGVIEIIANQTGLAGIEVFMDQTETEATLDSISEARDLTRPYSADRKCRQGPIRKGWTVRIISSAPSAGTAEVLVTNQNTTQDGHGGHGHQLQALLQWVAASQLGVPKMYFTETDDTVRSQLREVAQIVKEKQCNVGDLLEAVLKYHQGQDLKVAIENGTEESLLDWLVHNL